MASFTNLRPHREVRPLVLAGSFQETSSLLFSSRLSLAQVLSCTELDSEVSSIGQPGRSPKDHPATPIPIPCFHLIYSLSHLTNIY